MYAAERAEVHLGRSFAYWIPLVGCACCSDGAIFQSVVQLLPDDSRCLQGHGESAAYFVAKLSHCKSVRHFVVKLDHDSVTHFVAKLSHSESVTYFGAKLGDDDWICIHVVWMTRFVAQVGRGDEACKLLLIHIFIIVFTFCSLSDHI